MRMKACNIYARVNGRCHAMRRPLLSFGATFKGVFVRHACRNIGERLVSMLGWSEWSIVLFFP